MTREERYINLEKMSNTRDLGGYETQQGKYTKSHKYIRASSCANATEEDLEDLYDYGVRISIDLRSEFEKTNQPSLLKNYRDLEYYEVDLFQNSQAVVVPEEVKNYKDLGGFYIYIIEAMKKSLLEVFKIFVDHPYETILFHCSAGKDRTGIISGLLLDLVGCHDYDIVKDYSESYENNIEINEQLKTMMEEENEEYLKSSPRYMMELLDYLREHYGSSKEYLHNIGLSYDEIDELIENFTI
jgi:protein-tyrosine phosphatase